jgi:transcriptional regulator with XRE-family HTH domain
MSPVLRDLRLRLGWSQAKLGRKARLHPADVSRFESGRAVPYPGQLRRLARVLGVDEAMLLDKPAHIEEHRGGC